MKLEICECEDTQFQKNENNLPLCVGCEGLQIPPEGWVVTDVKYGLDEKGIPTENVTLVGCSKVWPEEPTILPFPVVVDNPRPLRTALITGISGQDGSYLAELLLGKGYEVIGLVRRSSLGETPRVAHLLDNPHCRFFEGDITDASSVRDFVRTAFRTASPSSLKHPIEIYNLAAQSHVGASFKQPAYTYEVVYGGFLNLLEALRDYEMETFRVYQASSSEMFGSKYTTGFNLSTGERRLFQNEKTPLAPNSPYAVAKTAAHSVARLYRDSYGMHISCGILFNHESPRRPKAFVTRKVTSYVARLIKHGFQEKLKLGNLDASRDWGFAGDYVEAMWRMLQQEKPGDFVIATGETRTVRDLVAVAFREAGVSLEEALEKCIELDESLKRPSEVPYLRGDAARAREVLGWKPTVSFESLIRGMVAADLCD